MTELLSRTKKQNHLFILAFFLLLISFTVAIMVGGQVSAQAGGGAGAGGGGGSSGCPSNDVNTCYGAVWVYETTNSDRVRIPGINGADVYATGCASSGGFFKYVLVHPNDANRYRTWQIGPVNGNSANASEFFRGGTTAYRLYSHPNDTLPDTLRDNGKYSWYAVYKAFLEAKSLGQSSGYDWDRSSRLGWFCYTNEWDLSVTNGKTHSTSGSNDQRRVGGTLQYTYSLTQEGWGVTNKDVRYRTIIKRMPTSYTSTTTQPSVTYVRDNGSTIQPHPSDGLGTINQGWRPGTRTFNYNSGNNANLRYVAQAADAGRWVCAYTYAYPNNERASGSNAREHARTCDYITDPSWTLTKETRSAVNPGNPNTANFGSTYTSTAKTANVGQRVFFLSQVTKDSNVISASFDRQRQRLIKYPDNRVITDCNAVRAGYTWNEEYRGCIWTGATGSSNWSASTTQAFYTASENDRSFFGSGSVPASIGSMRICERYGTDPRGSEYAAGWHYGGWNCVNINAAPYALTPTVNLDRDTAAPGETVGAEGTVNNDSTITSRDAEWQIRRLVVTPSGSVPSATQGNNTAPDLYFGGSQLIQQGNRTFPRSNTSVWTGNEVIGDLEVGSSVCYTLSVRPDSETGNTWSHGISCVIIAKKPKIQVLGGDLLVGRSVGNNPSRTSGVNTSTTNKTGTYYGSWAEYGIIANGCVQGMASGAGLAGGFEGSATTPPAMTNTDISRLTFTNPAQRAPSGPSCAVGNYTHAKAAPNVEARFTITRAASAATPSNPADPAVLPGSPSSQNLNVNLDNGASPRLNGEYQLPANVTTLAISGGTVGSASGANRGRSVIINAPTATVRINGNIRYTQDQLTAIGDIPQVVIIARNILIAENVTQVDAWLVAVGTDEGATQNGVVNTCAVRQGSNYLTNNNLTSNMCSDTLTINGPVIANHVHLRRTAGSGLGPDSGDPAEVFNLRADAYIWSVRYNQNGGRLSTMETVELPPRF